MKRQNGLSRPRSERLLATTRGRILLLLCHCRRTVADLAHELKLTDNAVRAQLERLQREGFAQAAGARRGVRRPHVEYELAPKARELFPKAYEPVLQHLVDVLTERLPRQTTNELLLEAGRSLLSSRFCNLRGRGPRQRLAGLLSTINGSAVGIVVAQEAGKTVVRSCGCPVASVTARHPEFCNLLASLLGEMLHADVRENCERGETPRCCFELCDRPDTARPRQEA